MKFYFIINHSVIGAVIPRGAYKQKNRENMA